MLLRRRRRHHRCEEPQDNLDRKADSSNEVGMGLVQIKRFKYKKGFKLISLKSFSRRKSQRIEHSAPPPKLLLHTEGQLVKRRLLPSRKRNLPIAGNTYSYRVQTIKFIPYSFGFGSCLSNEIKQKLITELRKNKDHCTFWFLWFVQSTVKPQSYTLRVKPTWFFGMELILTQPESWLDPDCVWMELKIRVMVRRPSNLKKLRSRSNKTKNSETSQELRRNYKGLIAVILAWE